jgi:hypothetical protein
MMRRLGLRNKAVRLACASASVLAGMSVGGCTTDEFVHFVGQTLYNSGRYACTQSRTCDVPADDRGPAASTDRR